MSFVSAFLFGLSANIDAFLLGLSFGLKKQRLPLRINLCLSSVTFLGTMLALCAGSCIAAIFPGGLSTLLGSLLLMALGCYYSAKSFLTLLRKKWLAAASLSPDPETMLSRRETLLLGTALALNNMGMGIGASFAGLSVPLVGLSTFLLCLLLLLLGNRAGLRRTPRGLSAYGDLLSGLMILLLGGWQLAAWRFP